MARDGCLRHKLSFLVSNRNVKPAGKQCKGKSQKMEIERVILYLQALGDTIG